MAIQGFYAMNDYPGVQRTRTTLPSLYQLRVQAGFRSQAAMAARVHVCEATYARVERGRGNPRPRLYWALVKALRIAPAVLEAVLGRGA